MILFFYSCSIKNKKCPRNLCSRKLLRIGFEACFFLCNPTTSSLPLLGHGVEYRHAISEATALGKINLLSFPVPIVTLGHYMLKYGTMPPYCNHKAVSICMHPLTIRIRMHVIVVRLPTILVSCLYDKLFSSISYTGRGIMGIEPVTAVGIPPIKAGR